MLGMKGEFYENMKCQHAKKEVIYAQIPFCFILQLVINANLAFNEKKFVQFVVILYLLAHGKHMNFFENMKYFMNLLKVKHYPKKQQCDDVAWGMVEALHSIIMQATTFALNKVNMSTLSCDEVTFIDNQFWITIHAYTIQNWTKVLLLLSLERIVDGFIVTNLATIIM